MEAPVPVALAAPHKRSLDDDEPPVSTPNKPAPSTTSTPLTVLSSMDSPSPRKNVTVDTTAPTSSTVSTSTQQPAKRRKLTPHEKEEQRLEKEAKAKARADKKVQKEVEDKLKAEQKAQKEEEKRVRDEEKRKKNEEKEEKKRAKELEQQQKEEELRKKERSQMRLNAFFIKPKSTDDSSGKATVDPVLNPASSQTLLAPETVVSSTNTAPPSPQKQIQKNAQTEYERFFLPFSLPAHAILAPYNAFLNSPEKRAAARTRVDELIAQEDVDMEPVTLETFRAIFPKRRRGMETATIANIVDLVNGSSEHPIDLTSDGSMKPQQPLDMLQQISMKYLHFPEDVRPPYYGTYTKPHSLREERKLARNPMSRGLPDLNYDYDSEAEWEEPEEGEDLDSDGEDDLDEDGDEDMDGFLDDEDDPQVKRRLLNGDQEPVSTGICWEDADGVSRLNDGSGAISTEFKDFRMGILLDPQPRGIDPFSTSYWTPEPAPVNAALQSATMNPPRLPLSSRPVNGLLNTLNMSQKPSPETSAKAVKPKRMIPGEQLPAFKAEIDGQDLTKIGMIEALKKKFPKLPKDAITNTLSAVAKRVGPSEKEKRWVLVN